MESRRLYLSLALLLLFISVEVSTILAQGNGNGNGNNGNNNGNHNAGNGNGNSNNGSNNGNGNAGSGNGNGNNGNNNGNGNGNGVSSGGGSSGNGISGSGNGNNNGNGNGVSSNGNGISNSGNGNGNNGNGNGSGNGNSNGNGNGNNGSAASGQKQKRPPYDAATTNYKVLEPLPETGQERVVCQARGKCQYKPLICPPQCPHRKPKNNKKKKGCFFDCSSKCEVTCRWRKPKCNGYGALCYDPRFIGGDGVMFYFHGEKGGDFAIVSDENLHINAHFIGKRPQGRTRDFTWVQALSVMFDTHTLTLAAKKVPHWSDNTDALIVKFDGESIFVPTDGEAEWRVNTGERQVVVERTDDVNTIRVTVSGLVEMDIRVAPIGEEENRVHNYQLPKDDSFAHLETQFRFFDLSEDVEGVLGKTYRPGYVSPVKRGVPMPMMGGEDKYMTTSLYSTSCKVCKFQRSSQVAAI